MKLTQLPADTFSRQRRDIQLGYSLFSASNHLVPLGPIFSWSMPLLSLYTTLFPFAIYVGIVRGVDLGLSHLYRPNISYQSIVASQLKNLEHGFGNAIAAVLLAGPLMDVAETVRTPNSTQLLPALESRRLKRIASDFLPRSPACVPQVGASPRPVC